MHHTILTKPNQSPAVTKPDTPVKRAASHVDYFVFVLLGVLLTMAVIVFALFIMPQSPTLAGGGEVTATPTELVQFIPTGVAKPFEPPVANQGGTCIQGSIIDVYHQARGSGWEVSAKPVPPETVDNVHTTTADSQGRFKLNDMAAGNYTVECVLPEGWQAFTPTTFQVTLNGDPKAGCAVVRCKVEALACIEVIKRDRNGSGVFEWIGLPGWKFTATSSSGITKEAVTDGEGIARMMNLPPGTWTIVEEPKTGWKPTSGYPEARVIDLPSPREPGVCQEVDFVNQQVHTGGIVVKKEDRWGKPLAGWLMTISRRDGTYPNQSAYTALDGNAYFDNLPLGEWIVSETVQDWWQPVGDLTRLVNLDTPGAYKQVTFVNEPLGCVDGYKINHLDQGLSGWQINAVNNTTGETFTTVTGLDGYFQFKKLTLGTWTISEVLQDGWTPVTLPEFTVDVDQQGVCKHVRFKNRTDYACVDVWKKDSYDGAGLPNWVINLQPAFGGEVKQGVTDGTGWVRFNQLSPGTYIVSEVLQTGWAPVGQTSSTITIEASGTCAQVTFYNRQATPTPTITPTPIVTVTPTYTCVPCITHYIIQPGDTLKAIARRFGISVALLRSANNLPEGATIYAGQVLCIPDP